MYFNIYIFYWQRLCEKYNGCYHCLKLNQINFMMVFNKIKESSDKSSNFLYEL